MIASLFHVTCVLGGSDIAAHREFLSVCFFSCAGISSRLVGIDLRSFPELLNLTPRQKFRSHGFECFEFIQTSRVAFDYIEHEFLPAV